MNFSRILSREVLPAIAVLLGLYWISRSNYLLYHSLAEVFAAVVAFGIFIVAWNSRRVLQNHYLLFIGIAYFFVACLDLLHMLAYKGMGVFAVDDGNAATQLWLAARYLESAALLLAPVFLKRRLNVLFTFYGFAAITAGLLASIFLFNLFPTAFQVETGLTTFKIVSEFIICILLILSLTIIWNKRAEFDPEVFRPILLSILATIVSELLFAAYVRVDEFTNFLGHYFKIISFFCMYVAIVQTGIAKPFSLLFRELSDEKDALKLERNFINTILDTAPAIITVTDSNGSVINVNSTCETTIKVPVGEAQGQKLWDVFSPETEDHALKGVMLGVASDNYPITHEGTIYDRADRRRNISWSHAGLTGPSGQVENIISIGVDITDRRRAEEALEQAKQELEERIRKRTAELLAKNKELEKEIAERKLTEEALKISEERYRTIGELIPYGVWAKDPEGKVIYLSQNFLDMIGVTLDECRNIGWYHKLHPDDLDATTGDWRHCTEDGNAWDYEHRIVDKDGNLKIVLCRGLPLKNQAGKTLSYIGIHLDITDRKQAEEEILRSRRLYKTFYENTPAMLHSLDDNARIVAVNNYWLEFMGYERKEVIGRLPSEFLTKESADFVRDKGLPNFFKSGSIKELELQFVKKNGEIVDVLFNAVSEPSLDAEGYRSLGVSVDITRLKRAEAALEQQTRELAKSNQDLEQFAFAASHDLQEPLRNVALSLQILERSYRDKLGPDAGAMIDVAIGSVYGMRKAINEILDYSRIEARGKEFKITDCSTIAKKVLKDFHLVISKLKANIQLGPLPLVMADSKQLEQVFRNLIDNALKFHSEAAPQIAINVERKSGEWVFTIQDNGIGLEQQYCEKVFIMFQRLNNRMLYPGTGVGLAMARRIVERHDGRIWIESTPSSGTTVHFTLPTSEKLNELGTETH